MDRLTRLLADDAAAVTAWVSMPGAAQVAVYADAPFDCVTIDMQHGMHGEGEALACVGAIASSGKPAILRIPVGRFDLASRALDAGYHGVIAPMINSLDDAKAFAAAMKYPPVGERSYGPATTIRALRLGGPGEYTPRANEHTLAIAMIETREALDAADDILALEGIDGILIGPADFSISIRGGGMPDLFGADTLPLIEDMAKRARKAGKLASIFCADARTANMSFEMGYRLIAVGTDLHHMHQGVDPMLAGLNFR